MIKKALQIAKKIMPSLMVLSLVVYFAPLAHAETVQETVEQAMATTIVMLLKFLSMILWPVLLMIGDLMDANLIIGPGMEDVLREIWVQVRNLVNIGFAIVMIIIAFYNLLGLGSEGNFALKTALPKLIIGIVIVNFTFLAGKIVIDVANIATTAVFQLPEVVDINSESVNFENTKTQFTTSICQKPDGTLYTTTEKVPALTQMFCELDGEEYQSALSSRMTSFFEGLNANNIGVIMAVNLGSLDALNYVDDDVPEFDELIINGLFSVVMFIVFAVSYIVLGAVLVFRVVVLWIAMALSPLAVLMYVVPQLKEAGGGGLDFGEKVTKHILAPIIIGATFCIGFIMIEALQNVVGTALFQSAGAEVFGSEFLITGIANMQQLIVAVTAIVVVWTGVFGATNGTFAQGIAETAKGFVENSGKSLLGALKYAPLVPVPLKAEHEINPPGLSFNQISSVPGKLMNQFAANEDRDLDLWVRKTEIGKKLFEDDVLSNAALHGEVMRSDQLKNILLSDVGQLNDANIAKIKGILTNLAKKEAPDKTDAATKIEALKVEDFNNNGKFEQLASQGYFGEDWSRDATAVTAKIKNNTTPYTPTAPAPTTKPVRRLFNDNALPSNVAVPDRVATVVGLTPTNRGDLLTRLQRPNAQNEIDAYFTARPTITQFDVADYITATP